MVGPGQADRARNLRASLSRFGHPLEVVETYDQALRNISKIVKLAEYLDVAEGEEDEVVVLLDAFDVLCVRDPGEIDLRGRDVVVSTERCFGHHSPLVKPYFQAHTGDGHRFLNSGVVAGRLGPLRSLYRDLSGSVQRYRACVKWSGGNPNSDQAVWSYHVFRNDLLGRSIFLDTEDQISICNSPDLNIVDAEGAKGAVFVHTWALYNPRQAQKYEKLVSSVLGAAD